MGARRQCVKQQPTLQSSRTDLPPVMGFSVLQHRGTSSWTNSGGRSQECKHWPRQSPHCAGHNTRSAQGLHSGMNSIYFSLNISDLLHSPVQKEIFPPGLFECPAMKQLGARLALPRRRDAACSVVSYQNVRLRAVFELSPLAKAQIPLFNILETGFKLWKGRIPSQH